MSYRSGKLKRWRRSWTREPKERCFYCPAAATTETAARERVCATHAELLAREKREP